MMGSIAFSVLSSGSKGNSMYIDGPEGAIVIDAGLSARQIIRRTVSAGGEPGRIRGILLTHEHSDHLRGVVPLARKLKIPVYGTASTIMAAQLPEDIAIINFDSGRSFNVAGFSIMPFALPHDAADPVGYIVEIEDIRIGLATDLGYGTVLVRDRLRNCRVVILESNHDEQMLMDGPYPWFLKQRVNSRSGHLSNKASSMILEEIFHAGLESVTLAHLSEINNEPELALGSAKDILGLNGRSIKLTAASVHESMPLTRLDLR